LFPSDIFSEHFQKFRISFQKSAMKTDRSSRLRCVYGVMPVDLKNWPEPTKEGRQE